MQNLRVELPDVPGTLADFGRRLGEAGISLEGGGVFAIGNGRAFANFLVADGARAAALLRAAGYAQVRVEPVVRLRLNQEIPGQLGLVAARMAAAGINLRCQYSDHAGSLVLVVDQVEAATAAARAFSESTQPR